MYAVQVVSTPLLEPFLDEYIVMRVNDFNITMGLVIRALGISVMVYPFLILVEIMCRQAPTVWSMYEQCMLPHVQYGSQHGVASCDSLTGVSSRDTTQREILPGLDGDGANKNNNKNDVTIIEMESSDDSLTSTQISADDLVSVATSQSSTVLKPDSCSCVTVIIGEDSATTNQNGTTTTEQDTPEYEATVSKEHHSGYFGAIAALVSHILLIALCVLFLLGSVASVHGLCWDVFWEWIATSIIVVLTQVIVLDMMKAVGMTIMRACASDKAATPPPPPYSIINWRY